MQKNKYTKYLTNLHNIMREREKKKKYDGMTKASML